MRRSGPFVNSSRRCPSGCCPERARIRRLVASERIGDVQVPKGLTGRACCSFLCACCCCFLTCCCLFFSLSFLPPLSPILAPLEIIMTRRVDREPRDLASLTEQFSELVWGRGRREVADGQLPGHRPSRHVPGSGEGARGRHSPGIMTVTCSRAACWSRATVVNACLMIRPSPSSDVSGPEFEGGGTTGSTMRRV
jgi:hypothetical protein